MKTCNIYGVRTEPAFIRGEVSPWRRQVVYRLWEASIPNLELYWRIKSYLQTKEVKNARV